MNSTAQEKIKKGVAVQDQELTISMTTVNEQSSPMSEEMKAKKRANSPSLHQIFENTLKEKGEYPLSSLEWSGDEMEVEGLSPATLHSFVLKAEELGKKITYTKTTKVKISD